MLSLSSLRPLAVALIAVAASGCATMGRSTRSAEAPLTVSLDSLFSDTALAHAHWGVTIRSLRDGAVLYQRNAGRAFVPASNVKVVTGAAALETLGPDFRYRTRFSAAGPVQRGVLRGPLVVRGTGDPTLSTRFALDARTVMRAWADSLRARGIQRVAGGIIGVDSAFAGAPLGAGWAWDDLDAGYAAEFGALQYNEGVVDVQVMPSRSVGEPGVVVLTPPTQYVRVDNRTTTAQPGTRASIRVEREAAGPGITVSGVVPRDTPYVVETVAVRDPTAYFLAVLRETLREAGVAVEGQALAADEWPTDRPMGETLLFVHSSPPLRDILPAMMKPSQNWIAETLLRTVGLERRREGTARAGALVVDSLLRSWNLPVGELRMADGSGLSRYNLITPELLAGILIRMRRSPHAELWYTSLPVAGMDGTLRNRLREAPLRGNIRAKTGTLSGIRSLSGYLTTAAGEPVVFSILVNHHLRSAATVDRVVDAALLRVVTQAR